MKKIILLALCSMNIYSSCIASNENNFCEEFDTSYEEILKPQKIKAVDKILLSSVPYWCEVEDYEKNCELNVFFNLKNKYLSFSLFSKRGERFDVRVAKPQRLLQNPSVMSVKKISDITDVEIDSNSLGVLVESFSRKSITYNLKYKDIDNKKYQKRLSIKL